MSLAILFLLFSIRWPKTDIAPNRNYVGQGMIYACAATVYKLNDAKDSKKDIKKNSLVRHEKPWSKYYFSSKNMAPGLPHFQIMSTKSGHRKSLFSTL